MDLKRLDVKEPEFVEVRNNELFPFLKNNTVTVPTSSLKKEKTAPISEEEKADGPSEINET